MFVVSLIKSNSVFSLGMFFFCLFLSVYFFINSSAFFFFLTIHRLAFFLFLSLFICSSFSSVYFPLFSSSLFIHPPDSLLVFFITFSLSIHFFEFLRPWVLCWSYYYSRGIIAMHWLFQGSSTRWFVPQFFQLRRANKNCYQNFL